MLGGLRVVKKRIIVFILLCCLTGCLPFNKSFEYESIENLDTSRSEPETNATSHSISDYLGESVEQVITEFGTPDEEELSAYDYKWLIYKQDEKMYIQFGVKDGYIVTIFVLGEDIDVAPFSLHSKYSDVNREIEFAASLPIEFISGNYHFQLNEKDLLTQPLIKLEKNLHAQLYFDQFTEELIAIRYLDTETLLKMRPYRMVYSGELLAGMRIIDEKKRDLEKSEEQIIYFITNNLRQKYGKHPLVWNDDVAKVARAHSMEMQQESYFDHVSPIAGDLKERMDRANIPFNMAGENIAAEYPDGIAACMGWLNSIGHRETMLHDDFTDLGIGVFAKHYTQNFIAK